MNTLEKHRLFWNDWDRDFLTQLGDEDERRGQVIVSLLESLHLSRPEILEVGCANGWFASQLADYGNVTGIDLADAAVEEARERNPASTFLVGDICSTDLPGSFDVIITMETFAHVPNQQEFPFRLTQMLKPGGYLLMTTQNLFVYDRKKPGVFVERQKRAPDAVLARYVTPGELRKLLSPHFHILKMFTIQPNGAKGILRIINSRKLNRLVSLIVPQRWLDSAKEWFGLGQTIVVLAKAY
jgi:2-polyprenyl-3-methyl-5-hydroxy-6-metoxy-1,4-benzoquinol methylase